MLVTTLSYRATSFSVLSYKPVLLLFFIALLGGTLRVYQLDERSLWHDEAYSSVFASRSISEIVTHTADVHPPLYLLLLHAWMSFFGASEQALRSFSAAFGTVAIVLMGLLGSFLYNRRTGLLAALFMAIMVFPLHYSREARGYSLFLVMTLGSFYFFLKSLQGGRKRDWLGYFFFTVGLSYTHYYWVFLVLAQNLYVLLFYWTEKPILVRWMGVQTGVFLCFLPWLVPFLNMTGSVMQEGRWIPRPGISSLVKTFRSYTAYLVHPQIVWGYILLCALGVLQVSALRGAWRWKTIRRSLESYGWEVHLAPVQRSSFLLLWFICPVLMPFLLSQFVTPIFWPRYTIVVIPALYLILARGVWQVPTMFLRGLVMAAVVLVSLASIQQYYAPSNWSWRSHYYIWENEPWRQWADFLAQRAEPTDVIVVSPDTSAFPFNYYAKGSLPYYDLPLRVNDTNHTDVVSSLRTLTRDKKRLWLLFRKVPGQKGQLLTEFLRSQYQQIAIEPVVKAQSSLVVLLFDLT